MFMYIYTYTQRNRHTHTTHNTYTIVQSSKGVFYIFLSNLDAFDFFLLPNCYS